MIRQNFIVIFLIIILTVKLFNIIQLSRCMVLEFDYHPLTEAVVQRCSEKFLKISQNSQESTCLFFKKPVKHLRWNFFVEKACL